VTTVDQGIRDRVAELVAAAPPLTQAQIRAAVVLLTRSERRPA